MTVDLGKRTGLVNLEKDQQVTIERSPLIVASATWSSHTDYDVYAIVLFRDGHVETASQFGTERDPRYTPIVGNGAVRHMGDIGREARGDAIEKLEIRLTDDIEAVLVVAYSARSNGTGSFHKYNVSLDVDNGAGTRVGINARNANRNNRIYTCVPAIIRNTRDGVVIQAVELYSAPNSENRPVLTPTGMVQMDAGEVNAYK